MSNPDVFDAKKHICKFGFELFDYATHSRCDYKIMGNMYQKEISIIFNNKRTDENVDTIGFKLSTEKFNSLLPLIVWEDYEKYRNLTPDWFWNFENGFNGYRDGWGYRFWCLNESGNPLLQIDMSTTFNDKKLPQYEKLLRWIKLAYGIKIEKHIRGTELKMMW